MQEKQKREGPAAGLSGKERGALEAFLAFIEERVKDAEPVCADLVRMARIALTDPESLQDPGRILH